MTRSALAFAFACAAALVLIVASAAPAQDCFEPGAYLPIVGATGSGEGSLVEVEMSQSWAFALRADPTPPALLVYSIHDPELPERVAEVPLPDGAQHLRAEGSRLYFTSVVGYYARLHIWDFTDPTAPVELGTMDIQSQVEDLDVEGNLLAMCTAHFNLSFIDVSDGANPVWLSDIDPAGGAIAVTHVDLFPTFAVCNFRGHVFGIAKVSTLDPTAPIVTFFDDLGLWLRGFEMEDDGEHGWAVDSDFNLYRVDLTSPGPTLTRAGGGGFAITVVDDLVITYGGYGLIPRIHQKSAVGVLSLRDRWPLRAWDIARKGSYLVQVSGGDGLFVRQLTPEVVAPYVGVEATERSSYPEAVLGSTDTPGFLLELDGDHSRLRVIDYTDPEHPLRRGEWSCTEPRAGAARGEDVVLAYRHGVRLLRLGATGALTDCGQLFAAEDVFSVLWDGDLLWLGSASSDLWLYDMADPAAPVLLHHQLLVGGPRHLVRVGEYLVVGAFLSGLYVLDVSAPAEPVQVAHLTDVIAEHMAVWGDHAYAGTRFIEGVQVVSLADPVNPEVEDSLPTSWAVSALYAHDDRLWAAHGSGLSVFELVGGVPFATPIAEPASDDIGNFMAAGEFTAIGSDYVYFMRPPCLTVTAVEPPEATWAPRLVAAPNPFNPTTTLALSLTQPGHVRVGIYDLRGRLVCTLLAGDRPAGPLTVNWNGRDEHGRAAPAGVYVARLVSGDGVAAVKLALVK